MNFRIVVISFDAMFMQLEIGVIMALLSMSQATIRKPDVSSFQSLLSAVNTAVIGQPDPPPKNETARMARYIVHYSDWCALAHISHHGNTTGFPVARVYSTADGFMNGSTGTPYFYVSKMDAHINDLSRDGRCSVTMSLAEGDYCRKQSIDPEDPTCAQVILTGQFIFIDPDSPQGKQAELYLFERHPVMKKWPKGHNWQVGKLKIGIIQVADNYGGSAFPSVTEYFAASP